MKYMPPDAKDRRHIGPNWNSKQLRGIQCILHATYGVVGPKKKFFDVAWGASVEQFKNIIEQPEEIIFNRARLKFPVGF